MLRREISLKSFVKKSNYQNVLFAIIFLTTNGHSYELFKKTYLMMFKPMANGEINMV